MILVSNEAEWTKSKSKSGDRGMEVVKFELDRGLETVGKVSRNGDQEVEKLKRNKICISSGQCSPNDGNKIGFL